MEDIRALLLATCASLARLSQQIHHQLHRTRYRADGKVDRHPQWLARERDPPSVWLAFYPPNHALDGVASSVHRVLTRLLAAVASGDDIDPRWACRVLLALSGEFHATYPPRVMLFAHRIGFELPGEPRSLHNDIRLDNDYQPGKWCPPPSAIRRESQMQKSATSQGETDHAGVSTT